MSLLIRWHPAKAENFMRGRDGKLPIAEVDHRMVGWLLGTRRYFTATSPRPVSTHFGIGHEARDPATGGLRDLCPECGAITGARGPLVVDQYVDLADTAYGNGNWHPTGGWPLLQRRAGVVVNPNFYTYSIEHEDGAAAGHGIVTPHIRRASVELSALLHRGSLNELRLAGVRIGDQPWHRRDLTGAAIATALKVIPVELEHFVDHHRISGILKPSCWQPWLSDRGFAGGGTQRAILAALAAVPPAPPHPPALTPIVSAYSNVRLRRSPSVTAAVVVTVGKGAHASQLGPAIAGGAYIVAGHPGRSWRRIMVVDGRRFDPPVWSAAPLWR